MSYFTHRLDSSCRLLVAGGLLVSGLAFGQVVFSEDFNAPDGSLLPGRVPTIGQAWTQPGGTAMTIQNGAINTAGESRSAFANFSQPFTGTPRLMKLTIDFTSMTFSGGYAGVSLFDGTTENMFVGSVGNRGGSISFLLSSGGVATAVPATPTGVVTVVYDAQTGRMTMFSGATTSGAVLGSFTGQSNLSFTRVRVENGGADIGVSSITAEMVASGPVDIIQFGADTQISRQGADVNLQWQVNFADTVSIAPGVGVVASNGNAPLDPPIGDTTYVLTATAGTDTKQASTTVRSVAGGAINYRYLRYKTLKTRSGGIPTQLSDFNFFFEGNQVVPVAVENPGNASPGEYEDANKVIDLDATTKWLDYAGAPLIFDFGETPPSIDNYAMISANDEPGRDPLMWSIEGSDDGIIWTLVENVTAFDYGFPLERQIETFFIPFPGSSLFPLAQLRGSASTLVAGDVLQLTYDVSGSQTATLSDGTTTTPLTTASGTLQLSPTTSTTYTLTSTATGGGVSTTTLNVVVINPAITNIAYANFDQSNDELSLLGGAEVLNDFLLRPLPGDTDRLRLTPELNSRSGSAWFRKRQNVGAGFETTFAMQISRTDSGTGADGLGFVVQNAPAGSDLQILNVHDMRATDALVVVFDTYSSGGAGLRIGGDGQEIGYVNLAEVPGLTLRGGTRIQDPTGQGAPYQVRISYVPGNLTVSVDGIVVLENLSVDLADLGAVDGDGNAYVGFSAATGGLNEAHDITSWTLTPGAPVVSELELISSAFNLSANQATLVWRSAVGKTYQITTSENLVNWSNLGAEIPGLANQTSATVTFPAASKRFFRVEEQ